MGEPALPLPQLLHRVLQHWGNQPAVCGGRLLGELRCGGYAVVPLLPTEAMITASLGALRRHGVRWGDPLSEPRKHLLRLGDATLAGHMELLMDLQRQAGRVRGG